MAPMTDAHGTPESPSEKDHAPDGHGGMALGPIDWPMWGAGIVGVVFAVIVTAAFVVATAFSFSA
jgi:hypothetical protein